MQKKGDDLHLVTFYGLAIVHNGTLQSDVTIFTFRHQKPVNFPIPTDTTNHFQDQQSVQQDMQASGSWDACIMQKLCNSSDFGKTTFQYTFYEKGHTNIMFQILL
jgi:hypothetical protein